MAGANVELERVPGGRWSRERRVALALVLVGFIVAMALSPLRHGARMFFWNFGWYWTPQALVLGVLLLFRPRAAVVAGAAAAMTLHFAGFHAWVREAMAWLFYLFSFPGALVGAASAALVSKWRPGWSAARTAVVATVLTALGIALNHWATVLTTGFGV